MTTQEKQIDLIHKMTDHIVSYREAGDIDGELKMWINLNELSAVAVKYLGDVKAFIGDIEPVKHNHNITVRGDDVIVSFERALSEKRRVSMS